MPSRYATQQRKAQEKAERAARRQQEQADRAGRPRPPRPPKPPRPPRPPTPPKAKKPRPPAHMGVDRPGMYRVDSHYPNWNISWAMLWLGEPHQVPGSTEIAAKVNALLGPWVPPNGPVPGAPSPAPASTPASAPPPAPASVPLSIGTIREVLGPRWHYVAPGTREGKQWLADHPEIVKAHPEIKWTAGNRLFVADNGDILTRRQALNWATQALEERNYAQRVKARKQVPPPRPEVPVSPMASKLFGIRDKWNLTFVGYEIKNSPKGESSEVSKDKVVRTFDSFASIMNVPKYTQRLIMTRMELAATYLSIEQINLVVYEYIGSPDAPEDEDID